MSGTFLPMRVNLQLTCCECEWHFSAGEVVEDLHLEAKVHEGIGEFLAIHLGTYTLQLIGQALVKLFVVDDNGLPSSRMVEVVLFSH